ncbi:adult-specific cuticular protein ACP-20-like [Topomyia yanbarensis]|uniref:adult-specific cuticular protein ACP-20-like n=1 Tax=Topomyia yanbarensis TaxID=2498891 RepID=UPI00273CCB93|nr:adult-specific cuticular protein ACP-20-like [Topomyia yanbarensis]
MIKVIFSASFLVSVCLAGYGHSDDWSPAKYKFEYGVKDPHTGDHKSQWEISNDHGLKGGYALDEPDGTKRVVSYNADKWNGFQAVVKRIGHAVHPPSYRVVNCGHNPWKQSNGWIDQQSCASGGWKHEGGPVAISYANQNSYH